MQGTLDIECERDRPVGLGATIGEGQKIKNDFSGNVGLRMYCKHSKFNQNRYRHFFLENPNYTFFLM